MIRFVRQPGCLGLPWNQNRDVHAGVAHLMVQCHTEAKNMGFGRQVFTVQLPDRVLDANKKIEMETGKVKIGATRTRFPVHRDAKGRYRMAV